PQASVAVQTRVMMLVQLLPEAKSWWVTVTGLHEPVVSGVPVTAGSVPLAATGHSRVLSGGQVMAAQFSGTSFTGTAAAAGLHVVPSSKLTSVKTSKKLLSL